MQGGEMGDENDREEVQDQDVQVQHDPEASSPEGGQNLEDGAADPQPEPQPGGWLKQLPQEQRDDPAMQELAREMPKPGDLARAFQQVQQRIGPQQPPEDGYGIGFPDDMPKYLQDPEAFEAFQETLREAGATKEQGQAIWSSYLESQRQRWNKHVQQLEGKKQEAQEQLQREWRDRPEMFEFLRRGLKQIATRIPGAQNLPQLLNGVMIRDADGTPRRLGDHPDMIRTIAEMGEMLAEAPYVPGDTATGKGGRMEADGDLGIFPDNIGGGEIGDASAQMAHWSDWR
jgi:hypothetical protein